MLSLAKWSRSNASTAPPPASATLSSPGRSGSLSEEDYDYIRTLVYRESRINLGANKRELVNSRLGKRLRATGACSFADYCRLLKSEESGELIHLIDAISTNHTYFFREQAHFAFLSSHILPLYRTGHPLRLWSAACSTGEEPYSIAITLAGHYGLPAPNWSLECSDISNRVLAVAAEGIYDASKLQNVSTEWRQRYFLRNHDGTAFRIRPELRARLAFRRLNLFQSSYPFTGAFDIIFCRNVMIYFDRTTQEELVSRLTRCLRPGGFLLIGHAESLAGIRHGLTPLKPAVYRRPEH